MTAPLPTPAEVEGMRERHAEQASPTTALTYCHACSDPWPCDAARLLALVDLRDKVAAVNRTFTAGVERERDDARARLAAVLAALPNHDAILAAQASWGGYAREFVRLTARIRRAATGEGS